MLKPERHNLFHSRFAGVLIRELQISGKLSQRQADALSALAMPDAVWGIKPAPLADWIRMVLEPRRLQREWCNG